MFKAILKFIAPYSFREPDRASAEVEDTARSIFSTHKNDDPIQRRKSKGVVWDALMQKISASMPVPVSDVVGTGMDDSGSSNLKSAYALSQPNISDSLMMWYVSQSFIGAQMCAFLAQNWLVNKACSIPARDAVRNGYDIVSADEDDLPVEILQEIKKHNEAFRLDGNMMEFLRHGRIFGVRILFFKVNSPDPDYYEKPFNIDGIRPGSYKGICQVDPYWTAPMLDGESASDPSSMHFYEPTWWMINGKKFHRTHLIIFRNAEVPDILKPSYIYGGVPVPQQIMERVYAAERTANEGPLLAMTKRTTVFSTNVAQAYANKDQFDQRMAAWVQMRDNQQVKIADKDADLIQQFDTTLADLDTVIMTQYQIVAAAANIPATKLLGTSPKGFGASGDYEISSYHEELESLQTHDLNPLMGRHLQLICRAYIKPKYGVEPALRTEWKPLDSPTATEESALNLQKAQTDAAYVEMGAIDGVDVRDRLIADPRSGYTGIAPALRPTEPEEENKPAKGKKDNPNQSILDI